MKKLFFLALSLLLYAMVLAQETCDITLSGYVIDRHDGSRLSFASIWLPELQKGVSADEEGKFSLQGLCKGEYLVIVGHLGCENDSSEISLMADREVDFYLEHHTELLREVQIESKKENASIAGFKELKEADKLESLGETLSESLERINGVRTLNTGTTISKPIVGGFSANRVQIINSGVQHSSQQWGNEHAPEIDPNEEATYSVIRGPGSVRYADGAIGGLVLVDPKPMPAVPGIKGSFSGIYASNNRMVNSSLNLEGKVARLDGLAWRVQGSVKKAGDVKSPSYYQKNTGVMERNYSWQLAYRKGKFQVGLNYKQFRSEIGVLTAAHFGNLTDLQNAIDRGEPSEQNQGSFSYDINRPKQNIIHELVKGDITYYANETNSFKLMLARQFNIREEFDKEIARSSLKSRADIPEFSVNLESYSGDLLWESNLVEKVNSQVGIQVNRQLNTLNSFTDFIPEYQSTAMSFYLNESIKIGKSEGLVGFRYSALSMDVEKIERTYVDKSRLEFQPLSLFMGLSRRIYWDVLLKGYVFLAERSPAINELYSDGLHHGAASIEYGNRKLDKEKARGVSLELSKTNTNSRFEVFAKWQQIDDFIYLSPRGIDLTIRGAYPSFAWENTDAALTHLDYSLGTKINPQMEISHSGSFLWARQLNQDRFLNFMPANRVDARLDYKLNFFGKKQEEGKLSLIAEHVFRQNRFNPDQEIDDPPAAYELLHFNFQQAFKLGANQLSLQFRINNLLNKSYRDYLNRFRFFAEEQGRDFRIALQLKF